MIWGHLTIETLHISHTNQNALYQLHYLSSPVSVPITDLPDCFFFLPYGMINYDVINSVVLHFYADIEENDIIVSLLEI